MRSACIATTLACALPACEPSAQRETPDPQEPSDTTVGVETPGSEASHEGDNEAAHPNASNSKPTADEAESATRHALNPGDDSPTSRESISSAPFAGTVGIVDQPRATTPALLTEVRSARHPGFDRFVWQFSGQHLPGYHIEYIDKPVRQCGSGKPTDLAGEAWLEIRLSPANAHTDQGSATIEERERLLDLGVAKELESTCDFEAVVTWVIGLAAPNRYRTLELSEPPRLVVDIRHD